MQQSIFVLLFACSGLLGLGVSYWVYSAHNERGATVFAISLIGTSLWSFNSALRTLAAGQSSTQVLLTTELLFALVSSYYWYRFCEIYTGKEHNAKYSRPIIFVAFALALLLGLSNPLHNIIWTDIVPVTTGSFVVYDITKGIGHHIFIPLSYLYYFTGIYYLTDLMKSSRKFSAVVLIVLSPFALVGANVLTYAVSIPITHPTTVAPLGSSVTLALSAIAVHNNLLEISPVARSTTFENIGDPLCVLDRNKNIVDFNESFEQQFGTGEDLVGSPANHVFPYPIDKFVFSAESWSNTITTKVNGEKRVLNIQTSPVRIGSNLAAHTVIFRDVTEIEQYATQIEKHNEYLESFSDSVAHELRNPLTIISGHAELLESEADGELAQEEAKLVKNHSNRMETVLNDFLHTLQAAQTVEEPMWQSTEYIKELLDDDDDSFSVELTTGDVNELYVQEKPFEFLLDTVARFVKHQSTEDDVKLSVRLSPEELKFSCSTISINNDHFDSVLQHGYTTEYGGKGLGLSVVKTMCRLHDWNADVTELKNGFTLVISGINTRNN